MQTEPQRLKTKVAVDQILIESPNKNRHDVLKAWVALILWLIVITIESTTLSSAETSRFLYPVLHFLFGIDWVTFQPWHHLLRKCGHVFGYALLSILLFRAWRASLPSITGAKWSLRWTTIAILGTAFVASLDEWHQSYIPSRTGTYKDVILDTCAGIAAQLAIYLISLRY